jgi:hypothetical protein
MEQDTGVALGQVHTYLDVDLYGVTHILEGINSRTVLGAVPFLRLSYLNGSDTPTGALNIDNPATDHVDYNSANQPGLLPALVCIDAQILINATDGFPQNKIKYDLLGKSAPNSNSFIHYLATLVPGLSIVQPPGAVGWNHPIFPGIRPPRFNP